MGGGVGLLLMVMPLQSGTRSGVPLGARFSEPTVPPSAVHCAVLTVVDGGVALSLMGTPLQTGTRSGVPLGATFSEPTVPPSAVHCAAVTVDAVVAEATVVPARMRDRPRPTVARVQSVRRMGVLLGDHRRIPARHACSTGQGMAGADFHRNGTEMPLNDGTP